MNAIALPTSFRMVAGYLTVPAKSVGRYTSTPTDYIDRFYSLLRKWQSETYYVSSSEDLRRHAAYRSIVRMGPSVVPLIVDELRREPSLLIMALHDITGISPFAESDRGNIKAMTDCWIAWAERET